MRKRVVIGLVTVAVIGMGVYVFSQPKKGSVEWHKREFLRARHWGIADEGIYRYGSREWMSARFEEKEDRTARHQNALIKLGYLEERPIVLHNRRVRDVLSNLVENLSTNGMEDLNAEFLDFQTTGSNVLRVITVKQDAGIWEQLIRKADAPDSEK